MGKIIRKRVEFSGASNSAEQIVYDNTKNVKTAISDIHQQMLTSSDVVDNLLGTSGVLPLSDNQGRILNETLASNMEAVRSGLNSLDGRVTTIENDKVDKTAMSNYLPTSGGTMNGALNITRVSNLPEVATGVNQNSFSAAPICANAATAQNETLRSGYGFHNFGTNGMFLYLDTDGRLKTISNAGTARVLAITEEVNQVNVSVASVNNKLKNAFTLANGVLTINLDVLNK